MEFDPCLDDLAYGLDDDLDDVEVAIDRALDAGLRRDIEDDFDYGGGSSGRCAVVEEWEHPPVRGTKSKRRGRLRRWAARDDKRGTFTGKHTGVPNPVCPPEWDMTPDEYRRAVGRDNEEHFGRVAAGSVAATAAGGAAMWPTVLLDPTGTLGDVATLGLLLAMPLHVAGGLVATLCGIDYLRWRHHDFRVLGERDPAQVISITDLPSEVCEVLLLLLDMNSSTTPPVSTVQRAERLHLGYRFAGVFTAAFEAQPRPHTVSPLAFLHQHCRTELLELAKYASTVSDPWTTQAATRLTLQLSILERTTKQRIANADTAHKAKAGFTAMRNPMDLNRHQTGQPGCMCRDCMISLPINSTAQFAADASAATRPAPALSAQQRWDAAVTTHERVIEAWTAIVTDPLAALDHTLLLDVTRPRTAAFLEAYGHAQDLAAIHGASMPEDAGEQRAYATAVRKADEAWTEAVRHARHVHLNWLPAEEEKRARQAKGLLSTAADEEVPMHVRAEAAKKAADLLAKVASFVLPPAATQALEANLRVLEARPADATAAVLAPMLHTEPA